MLVVEGEDHDQTSQDELGKFLAIEEETSTDPTQQVGTRGWDEGESAIATECLSSLSEIVELDDEYKENHEATTVDDDSQEVCKDDNA